MVNYLKATLNDTDAIGGGNGDSFWDEVSLRPILDNGRLSNAMQLYDGMYFSATTWRTIDGGKLSLEPVADTWAYSL